YPFLSEKENSYISWHSNEREALAPRGAFFECIGVLDMSRFFLARIITFLSNRNFSRGSDFFLANGATALLFRDLLLLGNELISLYINVLRTPKVLHFLPSLI